MLNRLKCEILPATQKNVPNCLNCRKTIYILDIDESAEKGTNTMMQSSSGYIGIDWGSSSFRAYRFDENVVLVDTIESKTGIKHVTDNTFEANLFSLIGHWVQPNLTILLSGMITSRNGWVETPYISIPANPNNLLAHSVKQIIRGIPCYFLPGLSQKKPRCDVMRGEELQLFGATQAISNALVVMPGTHSKWAQVTNGEVMNFQTIVTGELFDVLLNQTLVGQLANDDKQHIETFERGVRCGFKSSTIITELFQCRAGVLLEEISEDQVYSYLSGLLIGNEISEGLKSTDKLQITIVLVGSEELCEKYQHAFECLDIETVRSPSNTTSSAFGQLLALQK